MTRCMAMKRVTAEAVMHSLTESSGLSLCTSIDLHSLVYWLIDLLVHWSLGLSVSCSLSLLVSWFLGLIGPIGPIMAMVVMVNVYDDGDVDDGAAFFVSWHRCIDLTPH